MATNPNIRSSCADFTVSGLPAQCGSCGLVSTTTCAGVNDNNLNWICGSFYVFPFHPVSESTDFIDLMCLDASNKNYSMNKELKKLMLIISLIVVI